MIGPIHRIYTDIVPYETRRWLYKLRHLKANKRMRTVVNPSEKGDFSLKPYDEHHCIFVHVTKTGGTSISKGLFGYLPYHYTAIDYRVIYGRRTFRNYFKFCCVRNPWDRVYSAFRYLKAGGWDESDRVWAESNLAEYDEFGPFVKQWLTPVNIRTHLHFHPQYHFICDAKGAILVDDLIYFETLNDDFTRIAKRLHIDAELGHHNANPGINYIDAYDSELRNIVADIYARDIELLGYDFNGIMKRRVIDTTANEQRVR